ncbi:hypothetical protein AJ80_07167 [Polytolypa hystricis UAMH7299]|uniref:Amino acid transporter transmembrane domain-containing protein n=1 Tax=Polytolypa hystricis (strain UAMH7299) TaxID=1447883 RepID=A0A2B7XQB5_POLH7|nr:hypothetical protein AJ80_07167 [Polytolypa hystricis UAMH7299]
MSSLGSGQDPANGGLGRVRSHTGYTGATTGRDMLHGDPFLDADGHDLERARTTTPMRRRSSGVPNSIDNFARSWQRAAYFHEVIPRRASFVFTEPDEEDRPLLNGGRGDDHEPVFHEPDHGVVEDRLGGRLTKIPSAASQREALLHTTRSLGTSYGTIDSSRVSEATKARAAELYQEHHFIEARGAAEEGDREPLLITRVQRDDGTKEAIIVGQSTVPQTIFNSVNVLIGIGLLSLPLGFKYAGWAIGMSFLLFSALVTAYTAKILAKCLDVDSSLVTYADLAYISFGSRARVVTSLLFCLELLGACVALVVLFADSVDALIPGWGRLQWKLLCGAFLIPLNFVPLRMLSVTSILGIFCCTSIVAIVIIDGFVKPDFPGSLREPAETHLFPTNWNSVPLSFGLIMSPWGGHSVFPNIYRDMRHPHKYGRSLWVTYSFTYVLDLAMAISGFLMFGDGVRDEITSNILLSTGYPQALSICLVVFIAIIPVTKIPLSCQPIVGTIEALLGLDSRAISLPTTPIRSPTLLIFLQGTIRILTIASIIFIAIIFPHFDRIMALIGSSLCITICVIFPIAFYLKIFGQQISRRERVVDWVLLVVSTAMALVGTIWAFASKEQLGIK